MTTLTIPDIRDEAIRHLREQARLHHRTLEEEARTLLESDAPKPPEGGPRSVEEEREILERVRARRESRSGPPLTEEFLEKAKNWGRP
jgi:hypothetical protein